MTCGFKILSMCASSNMIHSPIPTTLEGKTIIILCEEEINSTTNKEGDIMKKKKKRGTSMFPPWIFKKTPRVASVASDIQFYVSPH